MCVCECVLEVRAGRCGAKRRERREERRERKPKKVRHEANLASVDIRMSQVENVKKSRRDCLGLGRRSALECERAEEHALVEEGTSISGM